MKMVPEEPLSMSVNVDVKGRVGDECTTSTGMRPKSQRAISYRPEVFSSDRQH